MKTKELASYMHYRYEQYAKALGWKTQKETQVTFDELPIANKQVMLMLAGDVLLKFAESSVVKFDRLVTEILKCSEPDGTVYVKDVKECLKNFMNDLVGVDDIKEEFL